MQIAVTGKKKHDSPNASTYMNCRETCCKLNYCFAQLLYVPIRVGVIYEIGFDSRDISPIIARITKSARKGMKQKNKLNT